jgi:hypothetical protein
MVEGFTVKEQIARFVTYYEKTCEESMENRNWYLRNGHACILRWSFEINNYNRRSNGSKISVLLGTTH